MSHEPRDPSATEALLEALATRLSGLPRGGLAELSRATSVPHATLRDMSSAHWRPVTIRNLIAVEKALAELDSAPGDTAERFAALRETHAKAEARP